MNRLYFILIVFLTLDANCQTKFLSGDFAAGCKDNICPIYRFNDDSTYQYTDEFNPRRAVWYKGKYKIYKDSLLVFFSYDELITTSVDSLLFYTDKKIIYGDSVFIEPLFNSKFCKGHYIISKDTTTMSDIPCSRGKVVSAPLIYSNNKQIKSDIEQVIQAVIDFKDIQEYYDTSQKKLIIQNYQFINERYGIHINKFGTNVDFMSAEQIKENKIVHIPLTEQLKIYLQKKKKRNLTIDINI